MNKFSFGKSQNELNNDFNESADAWRMNGTSSCSYVATDVEKNVKENVLIWIQNSVRVK